MNKFTSPESWADRKLNSLKARGQSTDREYVFLTSCVSARGEDIDAMTDGAWPLSMERELLFTSDPGHGWLRVSRADLEKLGILEEITSFSYQMGDDVYLEEDQDAGTYLKALDARGIPRPSIKEESVESTPIREYAHFQP